MAKLRVFGTGATLTHLIMAVAAVATLSAAPAFGGGLFAPFSMDSAAVLPKGVRSVRIGGFTSEISEKYSPTGQIVPLGDGFNKPVTWGNLVDSQEPGFERGQFKGGLQAVGISMDDVVGESRGIVNMRVTSTVPVLAYGVTKELTIGLAAPVLYSSINVSTGWKANPRFQATLDALSKGGFYNKVLQNEAKLQNVVATKIAARGYQLPVNETRTDLGDVNLVAKYVAYANEGLAIAISPKVVLPTGRTADVDKVVDVPSGDGQFDVGVSAVADYEVPIPWPVTLSASAGYLHQLPSVKAKRIPYSLDETLSADIDQNVREKLGDIKHASVGGRYVVKELWTLGAAYTIQKKERDSYEGSTYSSERYAVLANKTDQTMRSAQAGLSFSTVPLFRAQRFAVPLEAAVNYSTVLAGSNVGRIGLTSFDLAMYF